MPATVPADGHTGRPAEQTGRALLSSVRKPADLNRLTSDELVALAAEIRRHLVASVARTGGHLGPNLGVVELTIALHRTFRSPRGHHRLRHWSSGLRPQAAHRPSGLHPSA